jgi:hypothetical protein
MLARQSTARITQGGSTTPGLIFDMIAGTMPR